VGLFLLFDGLVEIAPSLLPNTVFEFPSVFLPCVSVENVVYDTFNGHSV
jgi:hypothetical protein